MSFRILASCVCLAAAMSGCAIGFGSPVPGLPIRHRESVNTFTGEVVVNESGGGPNGFSIGSRFGKANATVGSESVSGQAFGFSLDYSYAPTDSYAFGIGAGISLDTLKLAHGDMMRTTIPVEARGIYKLSFLALEGGVGLGKGGASFTPEGSSDGIVSQTGWNPHAFVGASVWIPFTGLALGIGGRVRRDFGGDVTVGGNATVPFAITEYLGNLNLTF